eukprot:scaffold49_cov115-Isochrysis_galbana.AAC.2
MLFTGARARPRRAAPCALRHPLLGCPAHFGPAHEPHDQRQQDPVGPDPTHKQAASGPMSMYTPFYVQKRIKVAICSAATLYDSALQLLHYTANCHVHEARARVVRHTHLHLLAPSGYGYRRIPYVTICAHP